MPSLLPETFSGTAEQRANREAELAPMAQQLSNDLSVGTGSPDSNSKSPAQRAFDAALSTGADPFGERLSQADVLYLQKMGVPMDRIERAARGSGMSMPAPPIDGATHDLHHEAGVAQPDASPSDYNFDLGRLSIDLPAERQALVHSTLAQWSSELKLDPILAKGIGEYVVEQGPRLAKFNEGQLASWVSQQHASLLKSVNGDKKAAEAIVAKAHKALSTSGVVNGERFSDVIKDGVLGKSAWLLQTLANHADAMEAATRAKAKL